MSTSVAFADAVPLQVLNVPEYLSTKVYFGSGVSRRVNQIVNSLPSTRGMRRISVITCHRNSVRPWLESIVDSIDAQEVQIVINPISNPTVRSIGTILDTVRRFQPELIVAVGGGSVLDAAKVVASLTHDRQTIAEALMQAKPVTYSLPLIAIPTTCGTGSEVTGTATVWDDETGLKHSMSGPALYPVVALVDPKLPASIEPHIAASTGLDALAHAIEATWSVKSTAASRLFALAAIQLIEKNLVRRVHARDEASLSAMTRASLYAGFAIAQASTTLAHAISYPLTARWGILHGHACAVSLAGLIRFNAAVEDVDCNDVRGVAEVQAGIGDVCSALGTGGVDEAAEHINELINESGLETFDRLGSIDLAVIARDVVRYDRFRNNPRRMDGAEVTGFLQSIRTR